MCSLSWFTRQSPAPKAQGLNKQTDRQEAIKTDASTVVALPATGEHLTSVKRAKEVSDEVTSKPRRGHGAGSQVRACVVWEGDSQPGDRGRWFGIPFHRLFLTLPELADPKHPEGPGSPHLPVAWT